jgi:hypothetical protein
MKKILSVATLAALFSTSVFANVGLYNSLKHSKPTSSLTIYGGGFAYSNAKVNNYKNIGGVSYTTKINHTDRLMVDLKYVYFNTDEEKPHKWDLTGTYTFGNVIPGNNLTVGGKYVNAYYSGHQKLYGFLAGIEEKKPNVLNGYKFGANLYYNDLSELYDNMRVWQADFFAKTKKMTSFGPLFLKNVLSIQHFNDGDLWGRDWYVSDTVSAKLVHKKMIFMGSLDLLPSSFKIEQNNKYAMDTSGNKHKWGVGLGLGYKVDKTHTAFLKTRYHRVNESLDPDGGSANEIKIVAGYKINF